MTDTTFRDWVHEWFYSPGVLRTPEKDRLYCFELATVLIHRFICKESTREDRRFLFDLLTYVLLGWNPVTAWPNASIFDPPEGLVVNDTKFDVKELLDFESSTVNRTRAYSFITDVLRNCSACNNQSVNLFTGEKISSSILALWLLSKTTATPTTDVMLIRACLDLFYTSDSVEPKTLDVEYASSKTDPNYNDWIVTQINRLLGRSIPNEELFASIAYIGWFASLVRVNRMMQLPSRSQKWHSEASAILIAEVQKLKATLLGSAMQSESEQIRDGSCLWCAAGLFKLLRTHPVKWIPKFGKTTKTGIAQSKDATVTNEN